MSKANTVELEIVCSWCKKSLGTKETIIGYNYKEKITHGICDNCSQKFESDLLKDIDIRTRQIADLMSIVNTLARTSVMKPEKINQLRLQAISLIDFLTGE